MSFSGRNAKIRKWCFQILLVSELWEQTRGLETTQLVKGLLYKQEDLKLQKKLGVATHTCNPRARRKRQVERSRIS